MKILLLAAVLCSLAFAQSPASAPSPLTPAETKELATLRTEQWKRSSLWWELQAKTLAAEKALGEINSSFAARAQALADAHNCHFCSLNEDFSWKVPPPPKIEIRPAGRP